MLGANNKGERQRAGMCYELGYVESLGEALVGTKASLTHGTHCCDSTATRLPRSYSRTPGFAPRARCSTLSKAVTVDMRSSFRSAQVSDVIAEVPNLVPRNRPQLPVGVPGALLIRQVIHV